jgi:hypothetical protein
MNDEQEAHLAGIKSGFCVAVDAKYRKGQAEHGGNLWKKPGMLPMLTEETLDFVVYARTLEQQLRDVLAHIEDGNQEMARVKLAGILDGPTD